MKLKFKIIFIFIILLILVVYYVTPILTLEEIEENSLYLD